MVTPNPVVATFFNRQEVLCLIDTGLEVIVMEYDFCAQRVGIQDQLDPSWLSLRPHSHLSDFALEAQKRWKRKKMLLYMEMVHISTPNRLKPNA